MRAVDDDGQHMCLSHLLEGCGERLDELGGQVLDEADGVGEDDAPSRRQLEPP